MIIVVCKALHNLEAMREQLLFDLKFSQYSNLTTDLPKSTFDTKSNF